MPDPGSSDDMERVALAEERLVVSKVETETGRVRLSVHVDERTERVRDVLRHSEVQVRRVPIDRFVDEEPCVREEGEVTIYPIVEEILVKRLLVREELHITRTSTLEPVERDVTLRVMRADVERTSANPEACKDVP